MGQLSDGLLLPSSLDSWQLQQQNIRDVVELQEGGSKYTLVQFSSN